MLPATEVRCNDRRGRPVLLKQLPDSYLAALTRFYDGLSPLSRSRFAPHAFDPEALANLFTSGSKLLPYCAIDPISNNIVGYAVVHAGLPPHEKSRLAGYGVEIGAGSWILAPAIAEDWQHTGLGTLLVGFVHEQLKQLGCSQVFLWGGVQAENLPAVRFYQKMGYQQLGAFDYQGLNYDMVHHLQ